MKRAALVTGLILCVVTGMTAVRCSSSGGTGSSADVSMSDGPRAWDDGGLPVDTGKQSDAGTADEAGVSDDIGTSDDTGTDLDGGTASDDGAVDDAGAQTDTGTASDTGTSDDTGPAEDSGADAGLDADAETGVDTDGMDGGGDPCVAPAPWPPSPESLFDNANARCLLPACSDACPGLGFDMSGNWVRHLKTTASSCSKTIQGVNKLAQPGNEQDQPPEQFLGLAGNCDYNQKQPSEHTGTIYANSMANCEANAQQMGVVSYETAVITFTAGAGTGTAHVFLRNVPPYVGGDCDFELEVTFTKQ